jgi:hypothetical protein
MPISLPTVNLPPTPKALLDILRLEGGQQQLPVSTTLAGAAIGAYAVAEMLAHAVEHSFVGSLFYGVMTAGLLTAITYFALKSVGASNRFIQTLTALGAMGTLVCLAYIVLHFVFSQALPPPLPSERLVRFLLFPLVVWTLFMFTWLYRHATLRVIPAFVVAGFFKYRRGRRRIEIGGRDKRPPSLGATDYWRAFGKPQVLGNYG